MLRKLSEEVVECYRRAREASEQAERAVDEADQIDFLCMERSWLVVAQRFEVARWISDFNSEAMKRATSKLYPVADDMLCVVCPACGKKRRLADIDSVSTLSGRPATSFACLCVESGAPALLRTIEN